MMKKSESARAGKRARLLAAQNDTLDLMLRAHSAVSKLVVLRAENKLCNYRERGVARELNDLIKVLSAGMKK